MKQKIKKYRKEKKKERVVVKRGERERVCVMERGREKTTCIFNI
jgi:hypothetical protein